MFKLHDVQCLTCKHVFEYLFQDDEPPPGCTNCTDLTTNQPSQTEKLAFSYDPSAIKEMTNPARQAEIMMKGANIRNKLLGKVPWRKNSSSQSD